MRFVIAIAIVAVLVVAGTVIAFAGHDTPSTSYVSIDPNALCAGSPYPSLAEGQFHTIAADCA
jgi:hypothetical protein